MGLVTVFLDDDLERLVAELQELRAMPKATIELPTDGLKAPMGRPKVKFSMTKEQHAEGKRLTAKYGANHQKTKDYVQKCKDDWAAEREREQIVRDRVRAEAHLRRRQQPATKKLSKQTIIFEVLKACLHQIEELKGGVKVSAPKKPTSR